MQVRVLTIYPDMAASLLKNNPNNRSVNEKRVAQYAKEMSAGNWTVNGDSIRISPGGRLLDGQHRLLACVASGFPLQTILATVEEDVFDTIDQGKKKSPGDILQSANIPNANNVAAAVRWVMLLRAKKRVSPSAFEVRVFVNENPDIVDCSSFIMSSARSGPATASLMAALVFVFSERDKAAAYQFARDFSSGANLDPRDPVHVVRNRLISAAMVKGKQALPDIEVAALLIRAWNGRRAGKGLNVVRGQITSASGDLIFPVIQ